MAYHYGGSHYETSYISRYSSHRVLLLCKINCKRDESLGRGNDNMGSAILHQNWPNIGMDHFNVPYANYFLLLSLSCYCHKIRVTFNYYENIQRSNVKSKP
jgi:hypothetical protein